MMRRFYSLVGQSVESARSGCSRAAGALEQGVSTSGTWESLDTLFGRLAVSHPRSFSTFASSSQSVLHTSATTSSSAVAGLSLQLRRGLHVSPAPAWLMRTTRRRGITLNRFMFNMFPRKLFYKQNKYIRNVDLKHYWRKHNPTRRATNVWNTRRLNERQALTLFYGIRGLNKYKRLSPRIPFRAWNVFRLEALLSNVVYRAGFAPTVHAARKMILQGKVLRNGVRAHIPSQRCKPGDVITLADRAEVLGVLNDAMKRTIGQPAHVMAAAAGLKAKAAQ